MGRKSSESSRKVLGKVLDVRMPIFEFTPFRLDGVDERLWRGHEVLPLTSKAFAVLRCLVTYPGQLVTKDTLMDTVWPETTISESTLTGCIWEVRRALGDSARNPHYIETVHGRGYRFIAPVTEAPSPEARQQATLEHLQESPASPFHPACLVGREEKLARLQQWYAMARQGQCQVGLIGGEPGIGKTALIHEFVTQVTANAPVWVASGQCIEQYGAGEPYLPLLEALGRLCRGLDGEEVVAVLRQVAPSWLVHLPAVLSPDEREALARTASGVTSARMMRELANALEILTSARALVLVLEDLHWSDTATLEWLHYVARRRDPAQLLILGTYRPVEVIVRKHPLHQVRIELRQLPQCRELVLDYLDATAADAYLRQRVGMTPYDARLVRVLHQRTRGNPLFLTAVVDDLLSQGVFDKAREEEQVNLVTGLIPASIKDLIEHDLDQLSSEDQSILETASVAGTVFSSAEVMAGMDRPADAIETRCAVWARRGQFLHAEDAETWPDGTVTARYRFRHALYQEVIYGRISPGRCVRLHQQIGERKEAGYGGRASEIAAELATHFMRGRDTQRAAHYLYQAGENALWRSAYGQAETYLSQSLELLQTLPDTAERARHELAGRLMLSRALMLTRGHGTSEVEDVLSRARALCQQVGDTTAHFRVQRGLWTVYLIRADLHQAHEISTELLHLAHQRQDADFLAAAHAAIGTTLLYRGDFPTARAQLEKSLADYGLRQSQDVDARYEFPSRQVFNNAYLSKALWILGYPQQALARLAAAHRLAQELAHPFNLAFVLDFAISLYQLRGEVQAVQTQSEALLALAQAQELPQWVAWAQTMQGWALAMQGRQTAGITQMREGMAAWRAAGDELDRPRLLGLLADLCRQDGQAAEGLQILTEALALMDPTAERWYEAELSRLKGELLRRAPGTCHLADGTPERSFQTALEIARTQQAKSWELRVATSLARLWQSQGNRDEARELLAPVYSWFTEGFDTTDLIDAKALLDELSESR